MVTVLIYFVQCDFAGATIVNNATAAQVLFINCTNVPAVALTSVTPVGLTILDDGSINVFAQNISLPDSSSFTGKASELDIDIDGADIDSTHTAVNYTAATAALDSHLAGIDTVLGTLGGEIVASVNGIAPVVGDVTVTAQDIDTNHTAVNYTSAGASITEHVAGIDTAVGLRPLTTATLLKAGNLSGLADVATARTNLGLGSAATKTAGSAIGNVLEIVDVDGSPSLPAIDASQVTGLDYTNLTNVPTSFITSLQYITDQNPLTLTAGVHYIMANATDTLKVLTVPDSANGGDIIRITNWGLGRLKLTTGGSNTTFLLSGLNVVGGETAGELFVESKCTVDLVGFDYAPADLLPAWGVYFISSIEINTKGLTTSGQAIVYNATTGKLEGGDAGDFASAYTPTNYTIADAKFDSHFAGLDTAIGLKAATADVLLSANDLSDLADVATARTNLGLGTAAVADTGTGAGDVVVLEDVGGTVKLPALDGSQLTNVFAAPPTYESKSANFTAAVDYHYSVSAASGNITCTLPARSGVALGKQIRFKLYDATNDLILTPAGSDTIDGLASYTLGNPKQSITLVRGANDWEIL